MNILTSWVDQLSGGTSSLRWERQAGKLGYNALLPYFSHTKGVLSEFVLTSSPGRGSQIDLTRKGSTTTHQVKLTHHPDGEAHFSQDGKIVTTVRSKTLPLGEYGRHLFTVQYFGTDAFERAKDKDLGPATKERRSVYWDVEAVTGHPAGEAGRFAVYKYSLQGLGQLPSTMRLEMLARPVRFRVSGEGVSTGIILFPRNPRPDDFFLSVEYTPQERSDPTGKDSLVVLGGFRESDILSAAGHKPIHGIAIHYTERGEEWADLERALGTVDVDRQPTTAVQVTFEGTQE